jgi:hypothetical protein
LKFGSALQYGTTEIRASAWQSAAQTGKIT